MYVARNGQVWVMPTGAEYLGEDSRGIPMYSTGAHVCEARPVNSKRAERG